MLIFAFMRYPYLVCILFGMPSLHLFTFLMFFKSCILCIVRRMSYVQCSEWGNWKSREREMGWEWEWEWERKREKGMGICAKSCTATQTLGYLLHEWNQGRLEIHGSLILFTSRTRKNWEGEYNNQFHP